MYQYFFILRSCRSEKKPNSHFCPQIVFLKKFYRYLCHDTVIVICHYEERPFKKKSPLLPNAEYVPKKIDKIEGIKKIEHGLICSFP